LDIGTEFVKALVFKVNRDKKIGEIVGIGCEKQRINNMQAGAVADINGVVEISKKAIGLAKAMAKTDPSQVIVGIAGEFVRGSAATFVCARKEPNQKIDLTELKNVIQKFQWQAYNKIRQDLAEETGISEIEIKLINATIIDIRIDGYRVTNPLGFQGKELMLSIFNAYSPLMHLGALQSIVDALNLKLLFVAAEPYAIAKATKLSDDFLKENAIFIDIGGGTTDLALVRQGGIEGIKSLALGGRAFTKRLSQVLGVDFDEAEQIKLKYSNKDVSGSVKQKITSAFKKDVSVWLSGVQIALEEFSQLNPLPAHIFLCGGGSLLPNIKRALEDQAWTISLPFPQPPEISFIQSKNIKNIIDKTEQLNEPKDITPLSLASLAIELTQDEDVVLATILKRALRLIQT